MAMKAYEKNDLLLYAIWLYYNEGLTQEKIAQKLNISRVSVTRMLTKARQDGLVKICITRPLPMHLQMEIDLEKKLGLKKAMVVKTGKTEDETLNALGHVGAIHMMELLSKVDRLGIGWSSTVSRMATYLPQSRQQFRCIVNELAGSMLGTENPYSISGRIAQALGVHVETIPVPAIVQNPETRVALMTEPVIQKALTNAAKCDAAFVGIGEIGSENTMVRTGSLSVSQMDALRQQGAVGEILLRYFDRDGKHIPTPIETHIISLEWKHIRKIPYLSVMAIGEKKVNALLGAIRGKLIDCLITDSDTADLLMKRSTAQELV